MITTATYYVWKSGVQYIRVLGAVSSLAPIRDHATMYNSPADALLGLQEFVLSQGCVTTGMHLLRVDEVVERSANETVIF